VLQGIGNAYGSQVGYIPAPLVLRTQLIGGAMDPTLYRTTTIRSSLVNIGTTGQGATTAPAKTLPTGSWTWRELLNWRELRRTAP
jgi:hypothetical protein